MSVFTKNELEYISEQRLGRLATVDMDGNPHVVPVGFRHNPETDTIEIAGGHPRVAFVVDDVLPPWRPRSIEILADAELLESGGEGFARGLDPQIIRLHPIKIIAWGIDEKKQSRKIKNVEANANQIHVIV